MNTFKNILTMLVSTVVTLAAAEFAYRIHIKTKYAFTGSDYNYLVCPTAHILFDDEFGDRPKPNDTCTVTMVRAGKVVANENVFASNIDGLDGRTTLAEYKKADNKILVFGDSFSHWYLGETWPDILQDKLDSASSKKTAVLNYARGAFGVLQMLHLAAAKIDELHPDMIVIAPIGDDMWRNRWWGKQINYQGIDRWIITPNKNDTINPENFSDLGLLVHGTTRNWAMQQMAHPNRSDPTLVQANNQYALLERQSDSLHKTVKLFTLSHSYLYSKIRYHEPFHEARVWAGIPRIDIRDFSADKQAVADINRIKASKIPVVLVYLPMMVEFKSRSILSMPVPGQNIQLLKSLEKLFGQQFYMPQFEYKGAIPKKIDLKPFDIHPNRDGLELYAQIVTPLVQSTLLKTAKK